MTGTSALVLIVPHGSGHSMGCNSIKIWPTTTAIPPSTATEKRYGTPSKLGFLVALTDSDWVFLFYARAYTQLSYHTKHHIVSYGIAWYHIISYGIKWYRIIARLGRAQTERAGAGPPPAQNPHASPLGTPAQHTFCCGGVVVHPMTGRRSGTGQHVRKIKSQTTGDAQARKIPPSSFFVRRAVSS